MPLCDRCRRELTPPKGEQVLAAAEVERRAALRGPRVLSSVIAAMIRAADRLVPPVADYARCAYRVRVGRYFAVIAAIPPGQALDTAEHRR